MNEDQILVKVNENDCFRLEKNSAVWEPIITNFIKLNLPVSSIIQNKNLVFIYEGVNRLIYISEDNGKSFKKFESITNARNFNRVLFNHTTNRIYISASEGVKLQYSDDIGKTWTADTLGIEFLQHHVPRKIYNLDTMEIQESNTGVYYRNATNNESWKRFAWKINNKSTTIYELTKHQDTILVSTNLGIFQFNGLDSAWLAYGQNIPIQIAGNMQSIGRFLFISQSNKGVYVSGDRGQTWNSLYLDTLLNNDFRINKFNNKIVVFTTTGVYNLDTIDFKWEKLGNNLSAIQVNGLAKANNKVYTSSYWFGIVESDLTGQYQHIMPKNSPKKIFIKENIIYTSNNIGAFQKEITSNTWAELHPLLAGKSFVQSAFENDTIFFINQAECMAFSIKNASCVKIGSGVNDNQITDLISYKGKLYTLSRNAIYILNRTTGNWDIIELNLGDLIFNKATVYKEKLMVATNNGLYHLNDSFNNWIPIDSTQKLGNISAVHSHNDKLFFAASDGQGVYFCDNFHGPVYPIS
ncbi:MAG: hypothetical protein MH472_05455 [Bacteroidia bacterium]|nr:hypothetical protein [Bacteroidia bacterium]